MPAGAEMDKLVAAYVMGQRLYRHHDRGVVRWYAVVGKDAPDPFRGWASEDVAWSMFRYSTDIASAWEVVEHLSADGWFVKVRVYPGEAQADVTCPRGPCEKHGNPHEDWHGVEGVQGETVPLAICRAALLAVGS